MKKMREKYDYLEELSLIIILILKKLRKMKKDFKEGTRRSEIQHS